MHACPPSLLLSLLHLSHFLFFFNFCFCSTSLWESCCTSHIRGTSAFGLQAAGWPPLLYGIPPLQHLTGQTWVNCKNLVCTLQLPMVGLCGLHTLFRGSVGLPITKKLNLHLTYNFFGCSVLAV